MSDLPTSKIHLVGSVPLANTEQVLRTCAPRVGDLVAALPDGEVADRILWINFQALRVYYMHPQLLSLQRPQPVDGQEQWIPKDLHDHWLFTVKDGVDQVRFDDLRYAGSALSSYLTFRELREEGVIPQDVRFQVALPMTYSGTGWFFHDPADQERVMPAYERALIRETRKICEAIPPADLSIQWDVCFELLDIEGIFPWSPQGDPWERYRESLRRLSGHIPEQALVGYHLCYADLGHQHMKEPEHLGLSVQMANAAVEQTGRRVDFFHMAVPRDRSDDGYFEPLADLDVGQAKTFLGLVHHTDGIEGTSRRIQTAKRHLPDFGIATECGFGRRPPEQVPTLLDIHREAAAAL
jgi:hypothetical protein